MMQKNLLKINFLALLLLAASTVGFGQTLAQPQQTQPDSLSAAEFSRLVRELSEEGGYFRSDNFTSNEMSYLNIADKLKQLGASGGAYLGVGPEQNFTYIARIRPRIAFLIDIRRQAILQHLMYKAIFHLAGNRPEFLSRLLSKPLAKEKAPKPDAPLTELLNFFNQIPATEESYLTNLAAIRKTIQEEFQFPLSTDDQKSLEYVYKSFRDEGLLISFRMDSAWGMNFPTFKEILEATDLNGRQGSFLASAEDYDFVRGLQRRNLIIPVVGDFGGKKAIAAVGDYLKKNNFSVTAFYTSNVEQYLFDGDVFTAFAQNVRRLPINDKSLFIRAVFTIRYPHPAQWAVSGLTVTLLQSMPLFLRDFDAGRLSSYEALTVTDFIAPDKPEKK
jgi:hypothetical protein